jgi:hypothetical protein
MKLRTFSGALVGLIAVGACTPISPSVHKSTLRPAPSAQIAPKQEDAPEPTIIEARWVHSEEDLNSALDVHSTAMVVRLSSQYLERLRTEGVAAIELPSEAPRRATDRARILLRVDLDSDELERALAEETWSFSWDPARPNTLEIRSFYGKKPGESPALPEALVSVHVVLQPAPSR